MWRRLGKVGAHGVEVELEGWEALLRIAPDRKEVHVLRVARARMERSSDTRFREIEHAIRSARQARRASKWS